MTRHFKNKSVILLLSLALLPVFALALCPCAEASSSEVISLHSMPCHSCCPEMSLAPAGCAGIHGSEKVIITAPFKSSSPSGGNDSGLLALASSAPSQKVLSWQANKASEGVFDSLPSHLPLYLSLNILRV